VKPAQGVVPTSFDDGAKVYIEPQQLLPRAIFLEAPKPRFVSSPLLPSPSLCFTVRVWCVGLALATYLSPYPIPFATFTCARSPLLVVGFALVVVLLFTGAAAADEAVAVVGADEVAEVGLEAAVVDVVVLAAVAVDAAVDVVAVDVVAVVVAVALVDAVAEDAVAENAVALEDAVAEDAVALVVVAVDVVAEGAASKPTSLPIV
jgi:hypothetical protein